jgi:WD40 repeat protein
MKILKILFTKLIILLLILNVKICFADEPILVIDPQGHSAVIKDVMFTPDGTTLISVSYDKTIRLWDVETGDLIKTIRGQIGAGHEGKLYAGALSPDGKVLAAGGYGFEGGKCYIHLFNIESGEQIGLLKGHTNVINDLAFSPDGRWLASGSFDKTVRIWEVARQKEIAKLEGHTDAVYGVAFSPDGQKLVSASYDSTLRLWDVGQIDNLTYKEMIKHTAEVRCVAFAPDGRYIVSGGYDDKILLWDGNGNFLKEIDKLDNFINTVSFSNDSKKIIMATGGGSGIITSNVYSIPSGEKITTFSKHTNTVVASAFYGNDLIATAGGNDEDVYIWDANSGTIKTHIIGKGKIVWGVACGEGLNMAFGNTWGIGQGNLEKSFDFSAMSLNPQPPNESDFQRTRANYSGKSFEKVGDYELKIVGDGTIKNDKDFDGWIRSYTFTPDGNIVVGSSFSLKLYHSDGTLIREFIGHTGEVLAVSVEPSGRILASASDDQTIKLWNLQSGELLATLFVTNDNEWICWTPEGYYAASAGGEKYIGWQINQGMEKAAKYYPVYTFRGQFYNPELVKRTIELASFQDALAESNRESGKKIEPEKITGVLPPEVTWLLPSDYYTKTTTNSITIKANVTSSAEITALKVQVNGGTVATTSQIKTVSSGGGFDKIIEYDVPLNPKNNEIRIYAENVNAFTTSKELIVFYESQEWMKPDLYMVSIGISNYLQADQDLKYADDDARAMSQAFSSQQGKLFRNVEIKSLYDAEATRANIINALKWLEESTTQKDIAVVFIAAHGYNERDDYYILPYDGDPNNLMLSSVDQSLFQRTLGNLPSRILLFLDTCHGGQLGMDLYAMRGKIDITEVLRELASEEYGMVIMAASTAAELSQERPEWGHGAFTKALIEGLQQGKADQNDDGVIHLNELDNYISERVKQLTNGKQHATTQKPSSISRFPIFQYE